MVVAVVARREEVVVALGARLVMRMMTRRRRYSCCRKGVFEAPLALVRPLREDCCCHRSEDQRQELHRALPLLPMALPMMRRAVELLAASARAR